MSNFEYQNFDAEGHYLRAAQFYTAAHINARNGLHPFAEWQRSKAAAHMAAGDTLYGIPGAQTRIFETTTDPVSAKIEAERVMLGLIKAKLSNSEQFRRPDGIRKVYENFMGRPSTHDAEDATKDAKAATGKATLYRDLTPIAYEKNLHAAEMHSAIGSHMMADTHRRTANALLDGSYFGESVVNLPSSARELEHHATDLTDRARESGNPMDHADASVAWHRAASAQEPDAYHSIELFRQFADEHANEARKGGIAVFTSNK